MARKKKSEADLREFLDDHLRYEVGMLKVTFGEVQTLPEGPTWNAMFESFGMHARNLYEFLRHKEGPNSFRADHYVAGHVRPDPINARTSALIQESFFHLSEGRLTRGKFSLFHAQEVYRWISEHWDKWLDDLPAELRKVGDSTRFGSPVMSLVVGGASATNAIDDTGCTTDPDWPEID